MINPDHGWISTLVPLDRETRPVYEFYVQAGDEDSRGVLYSNSKVKVTLLDVNDCAPEFAQHTLMGELSDSISRSTVHCVACVILLYSNDNIFSYW